jgi:hypothetical protein
MAEIAVAIACLQPAFVMRSADTTLWARRY